MCDKMGISAYILKIVEKDPFSRLQMRAKEMFNRHQFQGCSVHRGCSVSTSGGCHEYIGGIS